MAPSEHQNPSEAVARFDDPAQLEAAIATLQSHGFDRADISFIAREGFLGEHATAGREAPIESTDVRQGRTLMTSMAAVVAAFAAAGFTVATGGAAALAAGIAVAAGLGVGAAGAALGQKAGQSERHFLEEQMAQGGVLVWVRTRDAGAEQSALSLLRAHGGAEVHLHDLATSV